MQLWGKVVEGMILISKEFDVEVDARDNPPHTEQAAVNGEYDVMGSKWKEM